jgi:hypothetical protein
MLVNVTALWLSSVDGRFVFECRFMQAVYPTSLVGAPSAGCERERPRPWWSGLFAPMCPAILDPTVRCSVSCCEAVVPVIAGKQAKRG